MIKRILISAILFLYPFTVIFADSYQELLALYNFNKEVKELKINKAYVNELSNINSLLENRYIFNTNKEFNTTIDSYYDIFSNKQQDVINILLLTDPNTYIYYMLHDFETAGKLGKINIIKSLINN